MKKRVFIGLCLLLLAIAAVIHRNSDLRESTQRAAAQPSTEPPWARHSLRMRNTARSP